MRLIAPDAYRRTTWKNGLGSALELAADGPEWTWRLSIADVPSRTAFSAFKGVDRFIACLSGPGLALERASGRHSVPSQGEAAAFPGEEPVTGDPLGSGVRDINLMLRRDSWRGRMTLARGGALSLDAALVIVHAAAGAAPLRLLTDKGAVGLLPGHTLVASGRVAFAPSPGTVAAACELTPV